MSKEERLRKVLRPLASLSISLMSNFNEEDLEKLSRLSRDLTGMVKTDDQKSAAAAIATHVSVIKSTPSKRNFLLSDIHSKVDLIFPPEGMTRRGFLWKTAAAGVTAMVSPKSLLASPKYENAYLEDCYGKEHSLSELYGKGQPSVFIIAPSTFTAKKMKKFCEDTSSYFDMLKGIEIYKLLVLNSALKFSLVPRRIRKETEKNKETKYLFIDWGGNYLPEIFPNLKKYDGQIHVIVLDNKGNIIFSKPSPMTKDDLSQMQNVIYTA
jgi:hypothetical protein